jgi:hypothetical protein
MLGVRGRSSRGRAGSLNCRVSFIYFDPQEDGQAKAPMLMQWFFTLRLLRQAQDRWAQDVNMVSAVEPRLCVRRRAVLWADRRVASVVVALELGELLLPCRGRYFSVAPQRSNQEKAHQVSWLAPSDDQHLGRLPSRTARLPVAAKLRLSPRLENVGQSSLSFRKPDEPLRNTKG